MKILLILPYDNVYRYRGFAKKSIGAWAPLTLTTLAALVPPELGAQVDIIDEGVQKAGDRDKAYDVVGITCVTSSAMRAYALAEYWRKKGALVVLGGPHVTLMPEEATKYADAIVVGAAEKTWPQLLRDFKAGAAQKVYRADDAAPLSSPIPRRDLQARFSYFPAPAILANRGCRNRCHFCSIHKVYGHSNAARSIAEVIAEIKYLNAKRIILLDPSPTSDKEYARNFFEALVPLKIQWLGAATTDVVDDSELFELMVRSGCAGLLMGFESLSQASMDNSGKLFNRVDKYKEVMEIIHAEGIAVLGCFVLGFDQDTGEDLAQMADLVADLKVDFPRYAILTPFPGTNLFARLKRQNRILTEDWSFYDGHHVVFRPKHMAPLDLQQVFYRTLQKTYSLGRIAKRAVAAPGHKWLVLAANFSLRGALNAFMAEDTGYRRLISRL